MSCPKALAFRWVTFGHWATAGRDWGGASQLHISPDLHQRMALHTATSECTWQGAVVQPTGAAIGHERALKQQRSTVAAASTPHDLSFNVDSTANSSTASCLCFHMYGLVLRWMRPT